jgi:hypothetical protein
LRGDFSGEEGAFAGSVGIGGIGSSVMLLDSEGREIGEDMDEEDESISEKSGIFGRDRCCTKWFPKNAFDRLMTSLLLKALEFNVSKLLRDEKEDVGSDEEERRDEIEELDNVDNVVPGRPWFPC